MPGQQPQDLASLMGQQPSGTPPMMGQENV